MHFIDAECLITERDGAYIAEETNSQQTSFLSLLVQHCVD